ncbi:Thiamine pyrophosphate enzymeC-terminal TPP-binding [Penicillium sp. IBT 31633x]|nr:Thiamine pyrophosphate enzymeC-terminal TPP-binding [Penicillium sp. IBT 31633x]
MTQDIKLADYLFTRLRQLGVDSMFGVPGDYNLRLLDFVTPAGLHWVGNCNELNAAYAADGYGRIKGLSALITTYGVGELSAINGIAGAYAENTPVLHIVGTPPRPLQSARTFMHHTFSDGDYRRFANMAKNVTAAQARLEDAVTAPERIDYVLRQALIHNRPVYLEVPDDMPDVLVSAANLETKIRVPESPSSAQEPQVLARIMERVYSAKRPFILVDGESTGLGIVDQLDALIKATNWPTWTTVYGKGLINEQLPNVHGLYAGGFGDKPTEEYFHEADLVLTFGPHNSDTNTYVFSTIAKPAVAITFSGSTVQIENDTYRDLSAHKILSNLLQNLDPSRLVKATAPPKQELTVSGVQDTDAIAQGNFYPMVNPLFREGDIILTETGTAAHGGRHFKLPSKCRIFGAVTWLSIGFMLPATLGTALAQREKNKDTESKSQTILFIGDGSLQMTAQEISVMIREKLNIIIFIINNEGYTIERVIHGRKQVYNDVPFWRHTQALNYFGADEEHAAKNTFTARTCGELKDVLASERIQNGTGVRLVEVFMEREDVPQGALQWLLNKQLAQEKEAEEAK